jgi:predicted nucleic acid-binding protein
MNIFFDTSVLVASCTDTHSHFVPAIAAVTRVVTGQDTGFLSMHSIAEMFAALTTMPAQPRIHPTEAARLVKNNILAHFKTIPLVQQDYLEALETMVSGGWRGAKIYDVLLLRGAEKSGAERIYTFNLADFRRLAPAQLQSRICSP